MSHPLTVEATYNAKISKVWSALTSKEAMKHWFFNVSDFKPEVGFEFTFNGENEGRIFIHHSRILELTEPSKLSFTWQYENYPGSSIVTIQLFEEGNQTRATLTHAGLDTFPQNNPDFSENNFKMGWTHIIGKSLKEYVER